MASVVMLFTLLILISGVSSAIYSIYHKKLSAAVALIVTAACLAAVNMDWRVSLVFIPVIIIPLFKKLDFGAMISLMMMPTISLSYMFLVLFRDFSIPYLSWIALGCVAAVCVLGIFGVFENRVQRFLFYSNLLQLAFVVLDLSVGAIAGKLDILGTVQIFNYTWAGLLFFLAVGLLSRNGRLDRISEFEGCFLCDKINVTGAVVAGLSLVGLPGLNIFVSEFYLFAFAFTINPLISVLGVFAALILFIMYFKVPYSILVGREQKCIHFPKPISAINLGLIILCLLFGLVPQLQLWILTGVFA